jgi:hypothetical protein
MGVAMVDVDALLECAIQKRHNPAADLATRTALGKEFGRMWVKKKEALGLLTAKRNGRKTLFSRMQAIAVREAERFMAFSKP